MTQQFHSWVSAQEHWQHTCTQKLKHECSYSISVITQKSKQRKCPSADEWTRCDAPTRGTLFNHRKRRSTDTCSTWMNLGNIVLRIQTKKVTYCVIPHVWKVQNMQVYRDRKWIMVAWGWERDGLEFTANECGISFQGWWKCSGITQWLWLFSFLNILKTTELHTSKG